jgi:hypothetical protein
MGMQVTEHGETAHILLLIVAGHRPAVTIREEIMAHKKKPGAPVPPGNQSQKDPRHQRASR